MYYGISVIATIIRRVERPGYSRKFDGQYGSIQQHGNHTAFLKVSKVISSPTPPLEHRSEIQSILSVGLPGQS